ncbi:MAG: hypothetical protein ACRDCD_01720, partial [Mycoplasmoidaceae bacterium]
DQEALLTHWRENKAVKEMIDYMKPLLVFKIGSETIPFDDVFNNIAFIHVPELPPYMQEVGIGIKTKITLNPGYDTPSELIYEVTRRLGHAAQN